MTLTPFCLSCISTSAHQTTFRAIGTKNSPLQIFNWVVAHTLLLTSLLWYSKNSGVQSLQQGLRPHLSSRGVIWIAWLGLWSTSGTKSSHYFICSSRYRGYQGPLPYIRLIWKLANGVIAASGARSTVLMDMSIMVLIPTVPSKEESDNLIKPNEGSNPMD